LSSGLNPRDLGPQAMSLWAGRAPEEAGSRGLRPANDADFDKVDWLPGSVVFALMGSRLLSQILGGGLRVELSSDMDLEDGWRKRRS
jgi:hypothetical protein